MDAGGPQRHIGPVLVRKAHGRVGNWKNRRLVIGDGELSYGKKGSPPVRIALSRIVEVKLVSRYGEFVLELDDGTIASFRSVKRGMEEAMEWIRVIKTMKIETGHLWPSNQSGSGHEHRSQGEEDWLNDDEFENDDQVQQNENCFSVEEEKTNNRIDANEYDPSLPTREGLELRTWQDVDPSQWWCTKAILADGALQMNQAKPSADPFGLVEVREDRTQFLVTKKDFNPVLFLASFHQNTSFNQFQQGLLVLRRKLGTQDHRLHALIRDDISDFVKAARDVEALSLLFDSIREAQSNLGSKSHFDQRISHTHSSLHARFNTLLSGVDKTEALLTASNLLLLFAPIVSSGQNNISATTAHSANSIENNEHLMNNTSKKNLLPTFTTPDHIVDRWRTVLKQAAYEELIS